MSNPKRSTPKIATLAAGTLQDGAASKIARQLAGSVLSQTGSNNQTSSQMETMASKVLSSPKYSEETKSLAASVLSQSNKLR